MGIDFPPQWHLSPPSLGCYIATRSYIDNDIRFVASVSRIETAAGAWLEYDIGDSQGVVGDEVSRDWLWCGPMPAAPQIPGELLEMARARMEARER